MATCEWGDLVMFKKWLIILLLTVTFFFGINYIYAEEFNAAESEDKSEAVVEDNTPAVVQSSDNENVSQESAIINSGDSEQTLSADVSESQNVVSDDNQNSEVNNSDENNLSPEINNNVSADEVVDNENSQNENSANQNLENENSENQNLENENYENQNYILSKIKKEYIKKKVKSFIIGPYTGASELRQALYNILETNLNKDENCSY